MKRPFSRKPVWLSWLIMLPQILAVAFCLLCSVHADLIFQDNFESGDLKRWDERTGTVKIVEESPSSGTRCLEISKTLGANTGGDLKKWFMPGYDRVYVRFYVKFATNYNYAHHFVHLMGSIKSDRWAAFGKAGIKPDGTYFTTGMEPWFAWGKNPPPGEVTFYSYFLDMKEDPKMNKYWGNTFFPPGPDRGTAAAAERFIPDRGKWECWEFMLKCNTPGEHDGEQEMWIDGRKIGHFTNILWRDNADVKANCLWLMHYGFDSSDPTKGTWKQSQGAAMRDTVWFDDVVVSTEYIGPKKQ